VGSDDHSEGSGEQTGQSGEGVASSAAAHLTRPTLDSAVRRRRADRAFFFRLAGAIRQHERALQRLKR
jgi:hypothetical protein